MRRLIFFTGMLIAGSILLSGQQEMDPLDVADAIEDEYRFDHAVDVNKIDVTVIDGIAELNGTVDNLKAKERATRIAEMVKGVRAVSNRIKVDPPVILSDAGIRDRVESALLYDPATDSYEIDVAVNNQVVTLDGTVDSYQEKVLTRNVASSVTGVKDIVDNIDIDFKLDRSDVEIENEIEQALKWSTTVDDGLIDVDVNNGNAKLTGVVGSAAEKRNAYGIAWVTGVQNVDNSGLEVEWWAKDKDLRKNEYAEVSDTEIEDAIMDAALYDPRVYSFEITAEADNGWVTLRGVVDNLKAKTAAEQIAEHTTGVLGVTNRIKVNWDFLPPTDHEIEADIVDALADNSITEAYEVQVDVNNGIVTLSGMVDSYLEKSEAEWVASGVEGVTDVNNTLHVHYPYSYYWYGHYPYYDLQISPPSDPELGASKIVIPNDSQIKRNIENELWWSPFVDADEVNVLVDNGRVTLTGQVDSWKEYQKAAENAWEGGAWSLSNELLVE